MGWWLIFAAFIPTGSTWERRSAAHAVTLTVPRSRDRRPNELLTRLRPAVIARALSGAVARRWQRDRSEAVQHADRDLAVSCVSRPLRSSLPFPVSLPFRALTARPFQAESGPTTARGL